MNKFAATIFALCLAICGAAGFWIHIGNETMSPVLFAAILAAMILAPFAIIYLAFRLTKDMQKNGMAKAGLVSLAAAAVSLTGFGLWLSAGRRMERENRWKTCSKRGNASIFFQTRTTLSSMPRIQKCSWT